jgi:hypothetical protein
VNHSLDIVLYDVLFLRNVKILFWNKEQMVETKSMFSCSCFYTLLRKP